MNEVPELSSVVNFRDVGATVNSFLGERRVREGAIYRSARLDETTPEDKEVLLRDVGIRSVLDLRTKTEKLNEAKKRGPHYECPNSTTPDFVTEHYFHVSITGTDFERFLLSQLSWWGFICVIFLHVFGWRNEAIQIISREVMVPRGLVVTGLDTLDQSGPDVANALRTFTNPSQLPALTHCTLGKDRTGLITTVILLILGVPRAAIEHDYALTDAELEPRLKTTLADLKTFGLTPEWGVTADDMIERVEAHLEKRYGGLERYLDGIGFEEGERKLLREALLY
ncbi:hypothetical protein VUR80DRAFT_766 [Thermomyces stellatus]